MKALKKQNKMLFSMAKRSVSWCELKNNKKICTKASKKHDYSIIDSSSSDCDTYLSSDNEWDKRRKPSERNEINKLDQTVKNNVKNKDQCNDAIEYENKIDKN